MSNYLIKSYKYNIKANKGITLIEIIFVITFFLIILVAAYNLFFLSHLSYKGLSKQSLANVNVQSVISRIDKEVKQARKAVVNDDPLVLISSSEIRIYSDITNDTTPELIRYRVVNGELKQSYTKAKNNEYPYEYKGFGEETTLIKGITNTNVFMDLSSVNPDNPKDLRKKIKIHLIVEDNSYGGSSVEIISYLMTRSRVEAD